MGKCKARYGLTSDEVTSIMKCKFFKIRQLGATDWKNLDEFCKWAVENGYKPGMRLYKFNTEFPHSIVNSYFDFPPNYDPEKVKPVKRKVKPEKRNENHGAFIDAESPLCKNCETKIGCEFTFGCKKWKEYYVKNWNENIRKAGKTSGRSADEVFRYEHPDLVREGIVYNGS